jgi:hypothetical protein
MDLAVPDPCGEDAIPMLVHRLERVSYPTGEMVPAV